MEAEKILVVDDNKEIVYSISELLKYEGYETLKAYDGMEALDIMERENVDLILLDVMMPRMDGIQMTVKLREKYDFPVIFLSAKSEEVDKIMGLNMGADDYVTKPFTPLELLARVNSQLRRYRRFMEKLGDKEKMQNIHVIGGLELDEERVEVRVDGELVKVTPMEYKILKLLIDNRGKVLTHNYILSQIWGSAQGVEAANLRVFMAALRRKIEKDPGNCRFILTEIGVGYRFRETAE